MGSGVCAASLRSLLGPEWRNDGRFPWPASRAAMAKPHRFQGLEKSCPSRHL